LRPCKLRPAKQHSTGDKRKLGRILKVVERTLRRLLIIAASAVVQQASGPGAPAGSRLVGMLVRKSAHADQRGSGQQDRAIIPQFCGHAG
jgi:transposase